MALEDLNAVAAALSQTFETQLYHQFNREATCLSILEAGPGAGKNLAWDVEFSNSSDAASVAEGSDVQESEFTTDKPVPATLSWALYRGAFKLSETEIKAALSSLGSPEALIDILGDRMVTKCASLASKINKDIFTATGTGGGGENTIVGFYGGALAATGTYANIAQGTYAEWASTVLANGGTPRQLTVDLLNQAEEQLFLKCGRSPNFIMTSSAARRKYQNLFEDVRRVVSDGMGSMRMNAGATEYFYQGQPVRRDKDATSTKLIMGVEEFIKIEYLPPLGMDKAAAMTKQMQLQGTTGDPGARLTGTSIPFQVTPLSKTGNNVKFSLSLELQMKIRRRNAFVVIEDIATT